MATLGDMKTRIAAELRRPNLAVPIEEAIRSAIAQYNEEGPWPWTEANTTLSTVADQEYCDTPSDFLLASFLRVSNGGDWPEVKRKSFNWIEDRFSPDNTGVPRHYCIYADQFRFHPIPDSIYTLRLFYSKRLDDLASDSDSNAWTTRAELLIRSTAKAHLYAHTLRQPDFAAGMFAVASDEATRLKNAYYMSVSDGITPTDW